MQRMKISREGVLLIKSFEGFRPRALRRGDGRWVIGYGHTASAREGASVSEADAELLLQYDLIPVQAALSEALQQPVNQHQYDALASFAFSVGVEAFRASDVLSQVNAGAESDAADAMVGWPEPQVRDAGLRRRAAERALFIADPAAAVTLSDLLFAPVVAPPGVASAEAVTVVHTPAAPDAPFAPPSVPSADGAELLPEAGGPERAPMEPAMTEPGLAEPAPTGSAADPGLASTPVETDIAGSDEVDLAPRAEPAVPITAAVLAADPLTGPLTSPAVSVPLAAEATTDAVPVQGELQMPVAVAEGMPAPRLVLAQEAPSDSTTDAAPEDQGRLDFSISPGDQGRPFDARPVGQGWHRLWAYLVMGGFGLVSLAMSMAALRMAALAASDVHSIVAIALVLGALGAACVGISAYNIYQRLSDER